MIEAAEFQGTERFVVLRRIGQGGMGVVYRARDTQRGTEVALKTLRTLSPDGILRFKSEFRALQDLHHPNLVSLGELIFEGGQWFFTMELVDGVDFQSWVRPVPGYARASADTAPSDALTKPPSGGFEPYEAAAESASRPTLDEGRLRGALGQLARGLQALHAAGKVHRDVKPSNILVTAEGRVVILDFGLATDVGGNPLSEVNVVGTADYMAPEQAASQPVGPPADWYSLGVLLYEALTGDLPIQGAPIEVLIAKQRADPPPPSALDPKVPRDLDALCTELLQRDPARRPSGAEVLRRLGSPPEDISAELRLTGAPTHGAPFVGRARELTDLGQAFAATRSGRPMRVLVQGEAGIGKSALLRQFAARLKADHPDVLILSGRCHERESVPYKAFDGVIDQLARWMQRLPKAVGATLLPLRVGLLAQAFPVLRRIEAVAEAPLRAASLDPQELRSRVFAALRELFIRLSEQRPVAVMIDDLQWADADSQALLSSVLQPPDAPPLLVVASARAAAPDANAPPLLPGELVRVQLDRLPPAEARELARLLYLRTGGQADAGEVAGIAEEARGHPLFIDELVRHSVAPATGERAGPHARLELEEALWARVQTLDPPARRLLELAALAGRPLGLEAARAASELDPTSASRHLGALKVANLVRSSRAAHGDESYECFHDRVRAAVLRHLDAAAEQRLFERLALAHEADSGAADPEALCVYWHGAGDHVRAAGYAAEAAREASLALAFDRAAQLWRTALDLDPDSQAAVERHRRLGEALASLGRGGEAAVAYLAAAQRAVAGESVDLQRRAFEQLLVSGHIDEGLAGLRLVLKTLGLPFAPTPRRALASLVLRRLRLQMRGLGFRERTEAELVPEALRRIDVCWSAATGLGMIDTVRGADFQTRHLQLALEAGEPYRVCRALALEAAFVHSLGGGAHERGAELLAATDELARRLDHPHALALAELAAGASHFWRGEWRPAHARASAAFEQFRDKCVNVNWERNMAEQFALFSLAMMGDAHELHRRVPQLRRAARERGDFYAGSILRSGLLTLHPLAADEPERALEDLAEALSDWSQQGFQLPHFWELLGKVACDLYVGDGRTALDRLTARWPVMERSLVLRVQFVRVQAWYLRGRARLATAARLLQADPERAQLLALAERDARELEREDAGWSRALALLLRAGAAASTGATVRALQLLDQAERGLTLAELGLHAASARRRRGELLGGDEGEALARAADEWMAQHRVKNPRRMAALYAPGFPD